MSWQVFTQALGMALIALSVIAIGRLCANIEARYSCERARWALPLLLVALPAGVFCLVAARAA